MNTIIISENEGTLCAVNYKEDEDVKIVFTKFIMGMVDVDTIEFEPGLAKVLSKGGKSFIFKYKKILSYTSDEL